MKHESNPFDWKFGLGLLLIVLAIPIMVFIASIQNSIDEIFHRKSNIANFFERWDE